VRCSDLRQHRAGSAIADEQPSRFGHRFPKVPRKQAPDHSMAGVRNLLGAETTRLRPHHILYLEWAPQSFDPQHCFRAVTNVCISRCPGLYRSTSLRATAVIDGYRNGCFVFAELFEPTDCTRRSPFEYRTIQANLSNIKDYDEKNAELIPGPKSSRISEKLNAPGRANVQSSSRVRARFELNVVLGRCGALYGASSHVDGILSLLPKKLLVGPVLSPTFQTGVIQ
jgi:hypothetical protein